MHNRREVLTNLVTLTVTSNVSSVIEFNVGGVRESFTGTLASIKVDQGKTVEWRVSADGYISKNGTVKMDGDKDLQVSLDPSVVTLTVNSNMSSNIVLSSSSTGTVSGTNVTTKSISVNPGTLVNWTVSKSKYVRQSGSKVVNSNERINVSLYQKYMNADVTLISSYNQIESLRVFVTDNQGYHYGSTSYFDSGIDGVKRASNDVSYPLESYGDYKVYIDYSLYPNGNTQQDLVGTGTTSKSNSSYSGKYTV